tara:strand:- start:1235 stop:1807 length:573 start_codon:yes stop_codon:yes gene_type:complete
MDNNKYSTSKLPQTDLKVISAQQTNVVSKTWYSIIMEEFFDKQKRYSEDETLTKLESARIQRNSLREFSKNYILKNMNTLESYFQSSMKDKYLYLAWMPPKDLSQDIVQDLSEEKKEIYEQILALVVCDKQHDNLVLKCIITHPFWTSDNIEPKELKKCLEALETKEQILNVTEFYNDPSNIRFKLDWSF